MLNEIIDNCANGADKQIPEFEVFNIVAMDSLHRSFGNVNIDWKKTVDEFINNSIQNAWDNDLPLNIKLTYIFNDSEDKGERKLKSLTQTSTTMFMSMVFFRMKTSGLSFTVPQIFLCQSP